MALTALATLGRSKGPLTDLRWLIKDSWTLCRREFAQLRHQPGELIGIIVFPGIMVVMFGFVFGSAISIPGSGNYREYLLPGLFAMTALSGVMVNALLVSKDVSEGVMDRFRSIPMSRGAVPLGRAFTDVITSTLGLAAMVVIGLIVGWKIEDGLPRALAAFGLILLLRFALSWIGLFIGMSVSPETADSWVPVVFPISMLQQFRPHVGYAGLVTPDHGMESDQRARAVLPPALRQSGGGRVGHPGRAPLSAHDDVLDRAASGLRAARDPHVRPKRTVSFRHRVRARACPERDTDADDNSGESVDRPAAPGRWLCDGSLCVE